jgi:lactate permease
MGGVQYLVVRVGLWPIGAFTGSLAAFAAAFPLARLYPGERAGGAGPTARSLLLALSGYAILIAITLVVQVVPPVRQFLGQAALQVDFPETVTALGFVTPAASSRAIPIFRHAGASLLYTCLLAYLIYRRAGCYQVGAVQRIFGGMLKRVMPSTLSILAMVAMAVIMENSGMTDRLARGLAAAVGALFPLISPWIGGLGAFMTGSNTNSNVVFGALQLQTAELLRLPAAWILAAQTAGAALASVMAPAKVAVGASTAGMAGKEGEVMRRIVVYTLLLLALTSGLAALAVRWGG